MIIDPISAAMTPLDCADEIPEPFAIIRAIIVESTHVTKKPTIKEALGNLSFLKETKPKAYIIKDTGSINASW